MTTPNGPLLLDLFCGAGGAGMGYAEAGFEVVGVDIAPQPSYPFDFIQADALKLLEDREFILQFDAIHASPPCQASSLLTAGTNKGREYPQFIPPTRAGLEASGLPYVIENVVGAAIRPDFVLCGEQFGLGVIRHRRFEVSGFCASSIPHKKHRGRVSGWRHGTFYDGPYVAVYGAGGGKGSIHQWQTAMGIDWMTERRELAEAIPPAYTRFIATAGLMAALNFEEPVRA